MASPSHCAWKQLYLELGPAHPTHLCVWDLSTCQLVLNQQSVAFPPPTYLASDRLVALAASTACHWNGASLAVGCFEPGSTRAQISPLETKPDATFASQVDSLSLFPLFPLPNIPSLKLVALSCDALAFLYCPLSFCFLHSSHWRQ